MEMWVGAVALLLLVPVYSLNVELAYSEEEEEDANINDENDFKYSGDASTDDTVILAWNHRPEIAKEIEQIKRANAALRDIFGTRILQTSAATPTSTEYIIRYKGKFQHFGAITQTPTRTTRKIKGRYPPSLIPNFEVTERKPTRTALATVETTNLLFKFLKIIRTHNTENTERIVETTIKRASHTMENHSVDYVTVPTRTKIWSTNKAMWPKKKTLNHITSNETSATFQLSTVKEDEGAKLPQSQTLELLEVKPLQTQNTVSLDVKPLQTQTTGFLSGVQPHHIKYLDVPLKTSSKMLQTTNSLESSERTPSFNIDVRKFMWLYNYLRKLELDKLQQTINKQESLKTSASIGDSTIGRNQPAEPSSIPSRRVATWPAGAMAWRRTLPARRTPDDDLPNAQSLIDQKIVAKCYVCGLTSKHIPEDSNCSDAFSRREFLSLEPYDPRVRMQAIRFRRYCKYYYGYPWPFEHPDVPHSIFGEFTEGCSVRWTDAAGAYTQRACRVRHNPMRGNHVASKRMAQLEYLLRHSSEGCIESPMATLLPLSRSISLFARFHACVCKGNWCNAGGQTTPRMVTILLCSWFWKM